VLSNLFNIDGNINGKQKNFLKVMSKIPNIKTAMGDKAHDSDIALAQEAYEILSDNDM